MKRFLLLLPFLMLSACVYNQHTKDYRKGTDISPQQIAAVEIGKTGGFG